MRLHDRPAFRAFADYVYRALSCAAIVVVVAVIVARVPFAWSGTYPLTIGCLVAAALVSLFDAISTLADVVKLNWPTAVIAAMMTLSLVVMVVVATLHS